MPPRSPCATSRIGAVHAHSAEHCTILLRQDDPVVKLDAPFPFKGEVVWLTTEQGGRKSGPPTPPDGQDYAVTAFVPPHDVATGLASFVLRGFRHGAWRSPAEGRWLVVENDAEQLVEPGSVVVVTEGPHPVAYFHVERVAE